MPESAEISDAAVVYEATRMVRLGAAALVQTVPEEPAFRLFGPGFSVLVERTQSAALDADPAQLHLFTTEKSHAYRHA